MNQQYMIVLIRKLTRPELRGTAHSVFFVLAERTEKISPFGRKSTKKLANCVVVVVFVDGMVAIFSRF